VNAWTKDIKRDPVSVVIAQASSILYQPSAKEASSQHFEQGEDRKREIKGRSRAYFEI